MDQIGLNSFYDPPQAQDIFRQVQPAEFALSTSPLHDLHAFGNRAIFRLPQIAFQANVKGLMPAIPNCGEKAVVMRGIVI